MFSWICPQCGREVPPSYTDCPDCAAKGRTPAADPAQPAANMPPAPETAPQPPYYMQPPPQAAGPAPYPQAAGAPPQYAPYPQQYAPQQYPPQYGPPQGQYPQYAPPPPQYQPPPPQYQAPPRQYAPPPSATGRRLPTWLLTVIVAVVAAGALWGLYSLLGTHGGSQAAAPPSNVESPAAKAGAKTSPLQKYIEVSGIRFFQETKKGIGVKFTVTNHSDADASGLAGNVTIWARTKSSEEDAVGTFAFTADVPPQASKEVSAPLTTKLKMVDLPDWQFVVTDVQITAP